MKKRAISPATLRFQAYRCETAKHKRCKCRCGGALHGTKHSEEWIDAEVMRDRIACQRVPEQTDWVGYADLEEVYL